MVRAVALLAALVCIAAGHVADAHGAGRVEMVIGGLKGADAVDDVGQALVIEPGTQSAARMTARGPLARVLAWTPLVDEAARHFGVDSALLMAVMDVESGGNPLAVSVKGAKGLMQLMPQTGLLQGADDLFDPHQNILAGARLLDALLSMFGELPLALAAYNAGEGAVRKYGGAIPPYTETRQYVQRVMQRVAYYRRQGRKKSPAEPGFQKSLRPHRERSTCKTAYAASSERSTNGKIPPCL